MEHHYQRNMTNTHYITNNDLKRQIEQKTGLAVSTIVERNNIGIWQRRWMMQVGVYDDPEPANNGFYYLKYGKNSVSLGDNDNWASFSSAVNHGLDGTEHNAANEENYGDLVRADLVDGKIEYFTLITHGTKITGEHPGEYKQICFDSNWLYFCVIGGDEETAVWKKFPLLLSV